MREIELCPSCYGLTVKQPMDWFCIPCVSSEDVVEQLAMWVMRLCDQQAVFFCFTFISQLFQLISCTNHEVFFCFIPLSFYCSIHNEYTCHTHVRCSIEKPIMNKLFCTCGVHMWKIKTKISCYTIWLVNTHIHTKTSECLVGSSILKRHW